MSLSINMSSNSHFFVSPHLDDAVLSCGGLMYQLARTGRMVEVITIFAGDPPPGPLTPFAQSLHDRWQAGPAQRRVEDLAALELLGAGATHWPYPEAVYRRHSKSRRALYDSEAAIFRDVDEADAETIAAIAARVQAIEAGARVYIPLTAGHHVDHQLVRMAAESTGRDLVYYEEYPYVEDPDKLAQALANATWQADLVPIGDDAIRAKAEAILAYRSQLSTFFTSAGDMEQRVRNHAALAGGRQGLAERLWRMA